MFECVCVWVRACVRECVHCFLSTGNLNDNKFKYVLYIIFIVQIN